MFAIALMLFAILLRLYGAVVLPLILGIVALLIALFSGGPSKQPEPDPWDNNDGDMDTESESNIDHIGTSTNLDF